MKASDIRTAADFRKFQLEHAREDEDSTKTVSKLSTPIPNATSFRIAQFRERVDAIRAKSNITSKEPRPDPDMEKVKRYVHALQEATPAVRELVRRYARQLYGDLQAEETFTALPSLTEE